jgi:hypothetical protein
MPAPRQALWRYLQKRPRDRRRSAVYRCGSGGRSSHPHRDWRYERGSTTSAGLTAYGQQSDQGMGVETLRVKFLQHPLPWRQKEHPDSHTHAQPIRNPLGIHGQIYCVIWRKVWGLPRGRNPSYSHGQNQSGRVAVFENFFWKCPVSAILRAPQLGQNPRLCGAPHKRGYAK